MSKSDVTGSACEHFWLIDSPDGPTSKGTCRRCGARSEFKNSVSGSGWNRGNPQARKAHLQDRTKTRPAP